MDDGLLFSFTLTLRGEDNRILQGLSSIEHFLLSRLTVGELLMIDGIEEGGNSSHTSPPDDEFSNELPLMEKTYNWI
jgi:hypothetical protein